MDRDDLVVLRRFAQLQEAEIAVSTLEASHVDAILRDSAFGGFRPETGITSGGVTVLVRRDQLEAAREVLDTPAVHDSAEVSVTCANCGRILQGTVCDACDADDREPYLTPARTRASIGKLKLLVLGGTAALMILPTIIEKVSAVDEKTVLNVLAIAGGAVLLIVILKFFIAGTDERL